MSDVEDEFALVVDDTLAWAEAMLPIAAETWTSDYGMTDQLAELDVTEDDWDRGFAEGDPVELRGRPG